jgi:hypothetical protein
MVVHSGLAIFLAVIVKKSYSIFLVMEIGGLALTMVRNSNGALQAIPTVLEATLQMVARFGSVTLMEMDGQTCCSIFLAMEIGGLALMMARNCNGALQAIPTVLDKCGMVVHSGLAIFLAVIVKKSYSIFLVMEIGGLALTMVRNSNGNTLVIQDMTQQFGYT